ncbi:MULTISPECIES: hypothetical protein [unclassified Meridianimarinicoccus]|uniref:hypothetical protein n=1 Tax=unclassified Meridianimarinicoccus TaxID=2923344 RepID=UPI00186763EC|nr:hypothetical protein [Fluviibacterium sp. MJW13]
MTVFPFRPALVAASLALAPGLAAAQSVEVECVFTLECYEAEACNEANFNLRVGKGDSPTEAVVRTPAETFSGNVEGHDSTSLVWTTRTATTAQILSWGADGSARYTLHLTDGPAVVSYHGHCEAK